MISTSGVSVLLHWRGKISLIFTTKKKLNKKLLFLNRITGLFLGVKKGQMNDTLPTGPNKWPASLGVSKIKC